jgi:hypothetical protein
MTIGTLTSELKQIKSHQLARNINPIPLTNRVKAIMLQATQDRR